MGVEQLRAQTHETRSSGRFNQGNGRQSNPALRRGLKQQIGAHEEINLRTLLLTPGVLGLGVRGSLGIQIPDVALLIGALQGETREMRVARPVT